MQAVVDGGDEAIALTGHGFYKDRTFRGVTECLAHFSDGGVEAVFELAEFGIGPEGSLQFVAGDDGAGAVEEHGKKAKGEILQADLDAVFPELAGGGVRLKIAEVDET